MKVRTGPKAKVSFWAIRLLALVLQMFPIERNLRTARWLGSMWWRFSPRHRARTLEHLRASYRGTLGEAEIERIARRSFEHWAMFAVEFLCAFRLFDEWKWHRYIDPVDLQESFLVMMEKKGAILLTGHYGNFELSAYLLAAVGFDVVAVMRPLDNEYLNEFVVGTRGARGLRLLAKKGVSGDAEEILRRGGAIGFVADQDAGRKGVFVDFFGRKASTYKSIALLAMATESPIIVGYVRRVGLGFRYEARVERIIRPAEWRDQADPVRWITQEYTAAIESFVRRAPEQYLWLHRRWKSRPRHESEEIAAAAVSSRDG